MAEKWIPDENVNIVEAKQYQDNKNGLRIYCVQYPGSFKFQIRTHKPITGVNGKGKARNMIASITLTKEQIHDICEHVDTYYL